ncbi:hypothetical protein LSTR_LSTR014993 [Laodelphax striatellus]|uniref:Fibronectin type-III domain-containing protein n=1 Tax=Laodelphax striatellus TaxID=195883 RepID=A0A482XNQ6_LAOST|nr:hypothetical protein LSTR_LSTR014993 [Laodelphax striatellus]
MLPDNASPYTLRDLTPGGTYQVQLFTVYDNKESAVYVSRNFTTKPNTPGKFIVWFRNETTLLVLWQPSYPANIYTHYKVSIDPEDAPESVLYVEKDGDPPGPAQAAFKGLVPGRAYNISVQTVSDLETSFPTKAQYRTIPLRPFSFTVDKNSVTSNSFKVTWEPPKGLSEFDKYQIMINIRRQGPPVPVFRNRDEPTEWEFHENLEAGRTYQVLAKTVSGKVTSWPATVNVTLKPLPVRDLQSVVDEHTGDVTVTWVPDNASYQEIYKLALSGTHVTVTSPVCSSTTDCKSRTGPNPVTSIAPLIDSTNVTLEFPRPEGRIEWFVITWAELGVEEENVRSKNMSGGSTIGEEGRSVRALVEDLMPGVKYRFEIHTTSYHLDSDITSLTARTSTLLASKLRFLLHFSMYILFFTYLFIYFCIDKIT